MSVSFQPSLLDVGAWELADLTEVARTPLSRGAWVDHLPGWLHGADEVFAELAGSIPWRAERREMFDRVVDVPRLVHTYGVGEDLPHPALATAREALDAHYLPELGEPFVTAGCCYYLSNYPWWF